MAVVVVQRSPEYWTWFINSAIPKMGFASGLLIAIDKANVLPQQWGNLCFAIGSILGLFTVQYAAAAQAPRVPLTPAQADNLAKAMAKDEPPVSNDTSQTKALLLFVLFALGSVSCGAQGKQIAADVKACAESNAQAAISNLYPTITTIVTSDASNWEAQLDALGKEFGPFLICTLVDVYHDLKAKMPAPPVHGEIDPKLIAGTTRASVYLNKHGVTL